MLKYGLTPIIFDSIIFLFLICGGVALNWCWRRRQTLKRTGRVIGIILVIGWLTVFYGSFIEPRIITVTNINLTLKPNNKSTRIAIVSDLHVGPYTGRRDVARVVRKINQQHPDVVLLLGDFITGVRHGYEPDLAALDPLRDLVAPKKYAVLGNHDYAGSGLIGVADQSRAEKISQYLWSLGIDTIRNSSRVMNPTSTSALLIGVDDVWAEKNDLARALQTTGSEPDRTRILMAHNPDIILDPNIAKIQLVLAAHTHGGQIRLPGIGPLTPLPTHISRKYDQGIFKLGTDKPTLVITRGTGVTGPRSRLFAPPEIMILDAKL